MWPAQSATTPLLHSDTAGRGHTHSCPVIAVDGSPFAATTDPTQRPAWQRRLTLIARLQRETRRTHRAALISELRKVTTEALR